MPRWLASVLSTFQWLYFDETIVVSNKYPIIGEQVVVVILYNCWKMLENAGNCPQPA